MRLIFGDEGADAEEAFGATFAVGAGVGGGPGDEVFAGFEDDFDGAGGIYSFFVGKLMNPNRAPSHLFFCSKFVILKERIP